jgi:hypothetical protein
LHSPAFDSKWRSWQRKPGEHKVRPYGTDDQVLHRCEAANRKLLAFSEHKVRPYGIGDEVLHRCEAANRKLLAFSEHKVRPYGIGDEVLHRCASGKPEATGIFRLNYCLSRPPTPLSLGQPKGDEFGSVADLSLTNSCPPVFLPTIIGYFFRAPLIYLLLMILFYVIKICLLR